MNQTLTQKTLHGLKWSYISTISTSLMQIGYTAVMARLLNPSDFGLVAMGGVILRFGQYFAQMGLGSALIQKKELLEEEKKASFTSSLLLGSLFTLLFFFLAPLGEYIFKNNNVVPIIQVMAFSFLINGFALTPTSLLRRELKFKQLAIAEIIAFTIGYMIVGIGAALSKFGVWSLIYASISQVGLLGIISFILAKHPLTFTFQWKYYKNLYAFGSKVSVISFMEYISSTLDTFFIGRFLGSKLLGIYNRAFMLINLPFQYFTSSLSRVLFPAFSRVQDDTEKVKRNLLMILQLTSFILFPLAFLVSILSKEIVLIILGNKWLAAAPILSILAFEATFNLSAHFIAIVYEAKGILIWKMVIQMLFIFLLTTLFLIFINNGLIVISYCILFARIIYFLLYLSSSIYLLNINVKELISAYKPAAISLLLTFILFLSHLFSKNIYRNNFVLALVTVGLYFISQLYIVRTNWMRPIRMAIQALMNNRENKFSKIILKINI